MLLPRIDAKRVPAAATDSSVEQRPESTRQSRGATRRADAELERLSALESRTQLDPHFVLPVMQRPFTGPGLQWGSETVDAEALQAAVLRNVITPFPMDSRAAPVRCPMCKRTHRGLAVSVGVQAVPEVARRSTQVSSDPHAPEVPPPVTKDFSQTFDSSLTTAIITQAPTGVDAETVCPGLSYADGRPYNGTISPTKPTVAPQSALRGGNFRASTRDGHQAHSRDAADDEPWLDLSAIEVKGNRCLATALQRLEDTTPQLAAAAAAAGVKTAFAKIIVEVRSSIDALLDAIHKEREATVTAIAEHTRAWRDCSERRCESIRAHFTEYYYSLATQLEEVKDERRRMTVLMTPQPGIPAEGVKVLIDMALKERNEALKARRITVATQCPDREDLPLGSAALAALSSRARTRGSTGSPAYAIEPHDVFDIPLHNSTVPRKGNRSPELLAPIVAAAPPPSQSGGDRSHSFVAFDAAALRQSVRSAGDFVLDASGGAVASEVMLRDALASLLTRDCDLVQLLRTTTPGGPPVTSTASHASLFPTAPVVSCTSTLLNPPAASREPSRLSGSVVVGPTPKPYEPKHVAPPPAHMTRRFYTGALPESPRFTNTQVAFLAAARHPPTAAPSASKHPATARQAQRSRLGVQLL